MIFSNFPMRQTSFITKSLGPSGTNVLKFPFIWENEMSNPTNRIYYLQIKYFCIFQLSLVLQQRGI